MSLFERLAPCGCPMRTLWQGHEPRCGTVPVPRRDDDFTLWEEELRQT